MHQHLQDASEAGQVFFLRGSDQALQLLAQSSGRIALVLEVEDFVEIDLETLGEADEYMPFGEGEGSSVDELIDSLFD